MIRGAMAWARGLRAGGSGAVRTAGLAALAATLAVAVATLAPAVAMASEGHGGPVPLPAVWWVIPFALLLLCIAILPLKFPHWWEHNSNKAIVAGVIALPVAVYYVAVAPGKLLYHLHEYLSFIVLLWSLYTISGGIVLRGNLAATPRTNTIFLAIGAVIANLFGTTGASMLLIRPLLRTNQERKHKVHTVVFFIFVVSNVGGCLTPLGDPPLYMGFLQGIPFEWTLALWPEWLVMNVALLAIYYFWDRKAHGKEVVADIQQDITEAEPLRIDGWLNVALILGVIVAIIASGQALKVPAIADGPWGKAVPWIRDGAMVLLGLVSMATTRKQWRLDNRFNFNAIIEVAVLFIGIFITMIPALVLLEQRGSELGVTEPWQYFWATGLLSSFLDNTPTYLTFLSLAKGAFGVDAVGLIDPALAEGLGITIVRAISLGAVFMGANTYIGNGPNFMVKAIAEEKGPTRVDMPSFGGYMLYSFGILVPLLVIVSVVFFVLGA